MDLDVVKYLPEPIVAESEVYRALGYGAGRPTKKRLIRLIKEIRQEITEIARPQLVLGI